MAEKNDPPKVPQLQNSGAREKPKMPENRLIQGNDPRTDNPIQLIDTIRTKP